MYAAEKILPHTENTMYIVEISLVDLVFIALITCGNAHNAKKTAPRIPTYIKYRCYHKLSIINCCENYFSFLKNSNFSMSKILFII